MTTPTTPFTPRPRVQLTGTDGNAFAILGTCRRALRTAGATDEQLATFTAEATSGDYAHVLATAMRWCDVD